MPQTWITYISETTKHHHGWRQTGKSGNSPLQNTKKWHFSTQWPQFSRFGLPNTKGWQNQLGSDPAKIRYFSEDFWIVSPVISLPQEKPSKNYKIYSKMILMELPFDKVSDCANIHCSVIIHWFWLPGHRT